MDQRERERGRERRTTLPVELLLVQEAGHDLLDEDQLGKVRLDLGRVRRGRGAGRGGATKT
jgi:hypothetical protein